MEIKNFTDLLWNAQKKYMEDFGNRKESRFFAFRDMFGYFKKGQTIALIACGGIVDDMFLTMERIGREGKIILIDEDPAFLYNRALAILGNKRLNDRKEYYVKGKGKMILEKLFSEARIEAYTQRLPPYPKQVKDNSVDHIMAINAAYELMSPGPNGEPADTYNLILETYKKLRKHGSFMVQGLMIDDIELFKIHVERVIEKEGIRFVEDKSLVSNNFSVARGYWGRWVKG
ncbi:MAG: hypothetical protein DRP03_02665 [Candidatus Aenigmatarchaeota archaeon]|nr:MAG: hypothetical protein DRP03_02665 [Candidatus Aenigmarchaeota archaeon]